MSLFKLAALKKKDPLREEIKTSLGQEPLLSAAIAKLNTSGSWTPRWWEVRSPFLVYWRDQKSAFKVSKKEQAEGLTRSSPTGIIDLRTVKDIVADGIVLLFTLADKSEFKLRQNAEFNIETWRKALSVIAFGEEEPHPELPDIDSLGLTDRSTMAKRPDAKKTKIDGLKDEVSEALLSPCMSSGRLFKLSSSTTWQLRWWEVRSPFLMYWRDEKSAKKVRKSKNGAQLPRRMPLAALDLRFVRRVDLDDGILSLESRSGSALQLRASTGSDIKEWHKYLAHAVAQVFGLPELPVVMGGTNANIMAPALPAEDVESNFSLSDLLHIIEEEQLVVDELLDDIREDREAANQLMAELPTDVVAEIQKESFEAACGESFDQFDVDKNGVLSPDELYPLIVRLSGVSSLAVTIEHCRELCAIFDDDGSGNVSRGEFAAFARTLLTISHTIQYREEDERQREEDLLLEAADILQSRTNAFGGQERQMPAKGTVNDPSNKPLLSGARLGKERETRRRQSSTARPCLAAGCKVLHRRDSPFCHTHADMDPTRTVVRDENTAEERLNVLTEILLDHESVSEAAVAKARSVWEALPQDIQTEMTTAEIVQLMNQFLLMAASDDKQIKASDILRCCEEIGDLMAEEVVNLTWANEVISVACKTVNEVLKTNHTQLDFVAYCHVVMVLRAGFGQSKQDLIDRVESFNTTNPQATWAGSDSVVGENAFTCLREAYIRSKNLPTLEGYLLKRGDSFAAGRWNSWKLRYFRQEGLELAYYEEKPETSAKAEESIVSSVNDSGAQITVLNDSNLKGAINLSEIVHINLSLKTPVPVADTLKYREATGVEGDENVGVFKVMTMKKRRYVLAASKETLVGWHACFEKHMQASKSALEFRRTYGSGVPQGLTLEEQIELAKNSQMGKAATNAIGDGSQLKSMQSAIPGASMAKRLHQGYVVGKKAMDIYTKVKYSEREALFGVKWEYKNDIKECPICQVKFATTALRKDQLKHHCHMCGRVVCHPCSATMLYYEASGKRERTCSECIKNGGPPESCKSNPEDQVSAMGLLAQEAKGAVGAAAGDYASETAGGMLGGVLGDSPLAAKGTDMASNFVGSKVESAIAGNEK